VLYTLDDPNYLDVLKETKRFCDEGFWSKDILAAKTTNEDAFAAGKSCFLANHSESMISNYSIIISAHPEWKPIVTDLQPDKIHEANSATRSGMAIHATSKNPERVMMMMNLFGTHKDYYDLTTYGIEGTHYIAIGDNKLKSTDQGSKAFPPKTNCPWGWERKDFMRYPDTVPDSLTGIEAGWMKAGIESANMVTTVSPRYSEEIRTREYGRGLEHILNRDAMKLTGILNGIDYSYYNPETDEALAKNYSWQSVADKYPNKTALQKKLGLPRKDVPLLAVVSRLASHKGLDLITAIADGLVAGDEIQLVLLGQGEERYETYFKELEKKYPDKVRTLIDYNRELSRRIYAAADIFLMPSLTEPCGLSQMIASRYGAIPVVRETGGLYDSIKGYWEKDGEICGNGFTFANYSPAELRERIGAALALWYDREKRLALIEKIMKTDFSWSASAEKYMEIYNRIS
jgi:glycosyltransferase involved in cell wall biosynthesis